MSILKGVVTGATIAAVISIVPSRGICGNNGVIRGITLDESSKGIPHAKVIYHKLTTFTRDQFGHSKMADPGFSRIIIAESDGSFAMTQLAPGNYRVCAYGSEQGSIGNCQWDPTPVFQSCRWPDRFEPISCRTKGIYPDFQR